MVDYSIFFFLDEFCSDLMEAAIDLRHTYLGAFNPTQNVTQKLKTSLEKVRIANCYLNLAKSIIVT